MNKYQYKVQGVDYDVEIVEVEGNIAKVKVNGTTLFLMDASGNQLASLEHATE